MSGIPSLMPGRPDITERALHVWLTRHYQKNGKCERCGLTAATHYAFLHHPKPYTRLREDYEELCATCHNSDHIANIPEKSLVCEVCGSPFAAKRRVSRYCSGRCRQKAHRIRQRSAPLRNAEDLSWEEFDGRHDPKQRFAVYRLCECEECGGIGKIAGDWRERSMKRCKECRGEGRALQLVATVATPEAAGVALVELGREGEFKECPLGLLDRMPECEVCGGDGRVANLQSGTEPCGTCSGSGVKPTGTWLILPWLPSPRNASDAGKLLRSRRKKSSLPNRIGGIG